MTSRRATPTAFAGEMYLKGVYIVEERITGDARFPYNLPFVRGLDLGLDQPVTFFVGENGSGKSTLLEAIADLCGLHVGGGGSADLLYTAHETGSELARALRPRFRHRPRDGFFFRAETLVNFATLLEQRERDPNFDNGVLRPVALQSTKHYQITRGILESPERYWNSDGGDE
jgi:predicted ATPase